MGLLFLAKILLSAAGAAHAVDYETFSVLGWKYGSCSVALTHFGYPALGAAAVEEPVLVRVGRLTIAPGRVDAKADWLIANEGAYAYYASDVKNASNKLAAAGYVKAGFSETVRPDPVGAQPGLEEILRSTAALAASAARGWPNRQDYRISEIRYSPLSECALILYNLKDTKKDIFEYVLTRIASPQARQVRARAHVENALVLLNAGGIEAAAAETAIAARMAPEYALARYHQAMLLCLTGALTEALDELETALKLDPKFKSQARQERNFETLFKDRRFKGLTAR